MQEPQTYKLVVGVDFEPDGDRAIDAALDHVACDQVGELHVLFVDRQPQDMTGPPPSSRPFVALRQLDQLCERRVVAARRHHPHVVFRRVVTHYRVGRPAEHIVRLAIDLDADGIVVGTHGYKWLRRFVLGSVSEDVVHLATCPVLVARTEECDRPSGRLRLDVQQVVADRGHPLHVDDLRGLARRRGDKRGAGHPTTKG